MGVLSKAFYFDRKTGILAIFMLIIEAHAPCFRPADMVGAFFVSTEDIRQNFRRV